MFLRRAGPDLSPLHGAIHFRRHPLSTSSAAVTTNDNDNNINTNALDEEDDQDTASDTSLSSSTRPATTTVTTPVAAKAAKKTRTRTLPPMKDPIVVTDRAALRLRELLDGPSGQGAIGIRLGVRRRGCNGLSYTLDYIRPPTPIPEDDNDDDDRNNINSATSTPPPTTTKAKRHSSSRGGGGGDSVMIAPHGVVVHIEPMALFSVVGTTMDWTETELTSEFTFTNPNSKGECGCGESFTV